MQEISANEAKAGFSRLLHGVSEGKEYIITYHGKPATKLSQAGSVPKRDPRKIIRDILNLRTAKPYHDIGLTEMKSAVSKGRA